MERLTAVMESRDWGRLPERLQTEIEGDHVVLGRQSPAREVWSDAQLGSLVTFLSGGTPSKSAPQYWGGSIPWVSAKDMKRFRLADTQDHITVDGAANGTRVVPKGTVLLLARGMTLLNTVPVCVLDRDMAFNQDIKALRSGPAVLTEYLPYLVLGNAHRLQTLVDLAGHGTGRLNSEELKAFAVRLPPENEQRAIAHVLSTLDDKIELNRRMNETLEAMARAQFKSWFVDFEPVRAKMEGRDPGLPGHVADLFPAEIDDERKPQGWQMSEIGREVKAVGGATPNTKEATYWRRGQLRWATPKDLAGLQFPVLLDTQRKITDTGLRRISSGLLPVGTVLLSSRAPIGYLAITEVPTAINQGFIAMICENRLPNVFVLFWLEQHLDHIKAVAGGSTFAEISKKAFRTIPVIMPSKPVLDAYERNVRPLHEQVVANARESATLAGIRDTLLPKLISGEIRAPQAEKLVEGCNMSSEPSCPVPPSPTGKTEPNNP